MVYINVTMQRTQIYLSTQQLDRLKAEALRKHVTVSELIRRRIASKEDPDASMNVARTARQSAGDWLLTQATWAEKNGAHGPVDLASNVDKYLYGSS